MCVLLSVEWQQLLWMAEEFNIWDCDTCQIYFKLFSKYKWLWTLSSKIEDKIWYDSVWWSIKYLLHGRRMSEVRSAGVETLLTISTKWKVESLLSTVEPASCREGGWLTAQCSLLRTWHGSTPGLVSRPPIGPKAVVGSAGTNQSLALTGISSNQMTSC